MAESQRILADGQPPVTPPAPTPREARIPESDPVAEWAEEAEAFERKRASARAELRRESRADVHQRQASDLLVELAARVSALEDRVGSIAEALAGLDTLANGTMQFSNAVTDKLEGLVTLANKVDAAVTTIRAVHAREVDSLRVRLASSEVMHGREVAMLSRQLSDTQHALDQVCNRHERARDNKRAAEATEAVVLQLHGLREDIAKNR
jgi:hypothetical protein